MCVKSHTGLDLSQSNVASRIDTSRPDMLQPTSTPDSKHLLQQFPSKFCRLLWLASAQIAVTHAGSVCYDVLPTGLRRHYFVMGFSFLVLGSSCFRKGMKLSLPGMNGCSASGTL